MVVKEDTQQSICLYLHVHQPYRLTKLNYLELGQINNYFLGSGDGSNQAIIKKVAEKSYLPANKILLKLLKKHPEFKLSLSITGTVIEQFQEYAPKVLESFQKLVATGRVEILSETYYHSLAGIYSLSEFCQQIISHRQLIKKLFNYETVSFRNTELIYNDRIASIAKELGFRNIIAEGWDPILEWRSSNFPYTAKLAKLTAAEKKSIAPYKIEFKGENSTKISKELNLLLKNYKLSDDIAFRFSNRGWEEYPLKVDKYISWLKSSPGPLINLFMDYETFGEHQWEDSGIFDFLEALPGAALKSGIGFKTVAEAGELPTAGKVSMPDLISWADMERDLSAWNGNKMQQSALALLYKIEDTLLPKLSQRHNKHKAQQFLEQWRKLQTSDHFYYMSTKYWNDGDVHKYFSPYESPYEAFINYMNILEDFQKRLEFELGSRNS